MKKYLYEQYFNELNEDLKVGKVRENTYKSKKADLNTLYNYMAELGYTTEKDFFENVKQSDIDQFAEQLKTQYKPSTYNRKIATFKKFFNYLIDNSYIVNVNYFNNIKQISNDIVEEKTKEKDIISIDKVKMLLNATEEKDQEKQSTFEFNAKRNKVIITILTCYGSRIEEILSTKFSDIKETENKIQYIDIPKTRVKNRLHKRIFIANAIKESLEEYLKIRNEVLPHNQNDYIFSSINGKKLTSNNINEALSNLCKKANINKHITCHCFRHICTLALQEKSIPEYDIDYIIGWKKGDSMQQRYSKHMPIEKINKIISATDLL